MPLLVRISCGKRGSICCWSKYSYQKHSSTPATSICISNSNSIFWWWWTLLKVIDTFSHKLYELVYIERKTKRPWLHNRQGRSRSLHEKRVKNCGLLNNTVRSNIIMENHQAFSKVSTSTRQIGSSFVSKPLFSRMTLTQKLWARHLSLIHRYVCMCYCIFQRRYSNLNDTLPTHPRDIEWW